MNTTLNYIKTTIIEFITANLNSEVFIDTTDAFLKAYKDEIINNIISKPTYLFLYNHLNKIFKVHIIFFSYRDSKVVLNYCPTNINLQSHDFNEENTIATDPSLLFFIKTLIEIRNNAILIQDNMTLNQFERFEEVLSKFKKLMVLQSNEKITRAKVSQRGKKYPPLETKAINYVLKFLEEENIDMTNLFHTTALYQRCNPIESIETKKRKFIVSEPSTLNTSTSIETNMSTPSTKVMSIRSVGPPVHGCGARANVSLIISEATGPTNISLPTIMAEDSNIIKNYKHEFNNTPVKATSLMYQLDYSNTVNNFLNIQKIAIETIDGADMFLSMQIY